MVLTSDSYEIAASTKNCWGKKRGNCDFFCFGHEASRDFSMALLQNRHMSHHTHTSMQPDSSQTGGATLSP